MTAPAPTPAPTPAFDPEHAERLIRGRRATRAYRPDPVPEETLRRVFALAAAAPSSSNTQPWQVEVVSGAARDALSRDLLAAADAERLSLDFPYQDDLYADVHRQRRSEAGALMYGAMGVARDDLAGRAAVNRESLRFYGAPHVALLFLPSNADARMVNDVGMYAQTLLLALTAYGVASCPQGLLGFYADTIRASLRLAEERPKLMFGISFGYADPTSSWNAVTVPRADLGETTRFRA